jgi:hypothetical protein
MTDYKKLEKEKEVTISTDKDPINRNEPVNKKGDIKPWQQ